jgi:cell division protein FtsB
MKPLVMKIALIVLAVSYVAGSVYAYANKLADYAALQRDLGELRRERNALVEQLRLYHNRALRRDSIITELKAANQLLLVRREVLVQEAEELQSKLATARVARAQADSILLASRAAVDETVLPLPVFNLIQIERKAGEAARLEADACTQALGNCGEQIGNLESQLANKSLQIQEKDSEILDARTQITSLETFQERQDSTITELNKQLKPSFWKSATGKLPTLLVGAGVGILAALLIGG